MVRRNEQGDGEALGKFVAAEASCSPATVQLKPDTTDELATFGSVRLKPDQLAASLLNSNRSVSLNDAPLSVPR